MTLMLVLGNQLFSLKYLEQLHLDKHSTLFFMREDRELASYYRFHKHKIIFFFAAMRAYRDELIEQGFKVHYEEFGKDKLSYEKSLQKLLKEKSFLSAISYEIEDKFFESRIQSFFDKNQIPLKFIKSPMFLTSRQQFQSYLSSVKKPLMKSFYEAQRRRLNILMDGDKPTGGIWSFDTQNRLPLKKGQITPELPQIKFSKDLRKVIELVDSEFFDHPGDGENFWLPIDRKGAQEWLKTFLKERLHEFGPYEDAIPQHSEFVFHSVLTPFLNCGLLTPREVVAQTIQYSKNHEVPLASLEGFLRQVIGWREFVRGIYQNYDHKQTQLNYWHHYNRLSNVWYKGGSGVPPLDETIRRVVKRGYAHHIERLMVVGSLMVLLEIHPQEAHRWFMEMFIDSSDWVMGPNVYGMALFSDGGIFATKPYICGSNYLRKMGGYAKGEWCDGVDGLYWGFVRKHHDFFTKNPRLSMMARSAEKISAARWRVLDAAADELKQRLVDGQIRNN